MKKILILFIALFTIRINALSINISNRTSIIKGNNVQFIVTVSHNRPLGNLQYNVTYDSTLLTHTGGNLANIVRVDGSKSSVRLTFNFNSRNVGNGRFTFNLIGATQFEPEAEYGSQSKNAYVRILAPKNYSTNNFLKSLNVENKINFNRNTLEYTINLDKYQSAITINAQQEDYRAKVSGIGNIPLKEGLNELKVIVQAENGSIRNYIIKVNNPDKSPIYIEINKRKYPLIRKTEALPNILNFEASITKINGEDIPILTNKRYNIYAVKDDKQLKLLTKDKEQYIEVINAGYLIKVLDIKSIENYEIIKGLNLYDDKTYIFRYDKKDNILQKEYIIPKPKKQKLDIKDILILSVSVVTLIMIIINIILVIKLRRKHEN